MTLDEARAAIGGKVVYCRIRMKTPDGRRILWDEGFEEGVITSVNEHYVFVRYAASSQSQATKPEDLEPVR